MRFSRVSVESIAYELPPNVVMSSAFEARLAPVYKELRLQAGQLEALTGIRERRFWDAGTTMAEGATRAGRKALETSRIAPEDIGLLIYAGVCRDYWEPANACAVAEGLGLSSKTHIYDVSNACLGVMNGIVQIANAIELGQVRAGLVVSCESSRQIVDLTIEKMLGNRDLKTFWSSLAVLTGGSGAIGVVVCESGLAPEGHRLIGGVARSRTKYHDICRWYPATSGPEPKPTELITDSTAVLEHGVALGRETWDAFLEALGWTVEQVDRTICHQVGAPHRSTVLRELGVPEEKDFQTYEFLGNIGTVSLPITATIAEERGFLEKGHRVAFCGIGSGLNCLVLGMKW